MQRRGGVGRDKRVSSAASGLRRTSSGGPFSGPQVVLICLLCTFAIFGSWRRGHPVPVPGGIEPTAQPSQASPQDGRDGGTDALAADLKALIRRVNAAGGRLPVGAVPAVRAIEDRLRPLLAYLAGRPPRPEVIRRLSAVIREYLPEAVDSFLVLPARYARAPSSVGGTTPANDLLAQLARLLDAADELQSDVYEHDARQLAVQREFLDSKFRHSDLDL